MTKSSASLLLQFSQPEVSRSAIVTSSGSYGISLCIADTFVKRWRGLMLALPLRADQGLLLTRCNSIHTCFMRQVIDVLYLNDDGFVTRCVPSVRPWRVSFGNIVGWPGGKGMHVVELGAGSISRLNVAVGSRVVHEIFEDGTPCESHTSTAARKEASAGPTLTLRGNDIKLQRGSAIIEFAVVAPIMTLIGLATIQFGLLFVAKNQYNHAIFMAARAGTFQHADLNAITEAYARALAPIYGGGGNQAEIAASVARAAADIAANAEVEILNPTRESFADFNDPDLQWRLGLGDRRVIPNGGLARKKPAIVEATSGQNIHDANLLKVRIRQGYKPQVPIIGAIYVRYLKWLDTGATISDTKMLNAGLVPVVSHATLQMQSDAIEGAMVSSPGLVDSGIADNSGMLPVSRAPAPVCGNVFCSEAPIAPVVERQ